MPKLNVSKSVERTIFYTIETFEIHIWRHNFHARNSRDSKNSAIAWKRKRIEIFFVRNQSNNVTFINMLPEMRNRTWKSYKSASSSAPSSDPEAELQGKSTNTIKLDPLIRTRGSSQLENLFSTSFPFSWGREESTRERARERRMWRKVWARERQSWYIYL